MRSSLKKVAVLGGTFDPPTISHLQVCSETIHQYNFDEVWIVPCGDREDKPSRTPGPDRLNMCKLAVQDFFHSDFPVHVNDIEIQNVKTIPTYHLLERLENIYKATHEFYFIIGADLVPQLKNWDKGHKLLSEKKFVIHTRGGFEHINLSTANPDMPKEFILSDPLESLIGMISSTEVRNRITNAKQKIKSSQDDAQEHFAMFDEMKKDLNEVETISLVPSKYYNISGLVPKNVIDYISDKGLY